MNIIKRDLSIEINATLEKLWGIIADDFTEVSKWVDVVKTSSPNPATPNGLNGSRHGGRVCEVEGLGKIEECITAYDANTHSLSYTVQSPNLPPFLEKLENSWTIRSIGSGKSNVDIHLEVSTSTDISSDSEAIGFANAIAESVIGASKNLKNYAEKA